MQDGLLLLVEGSLAIPHGHLPFDISPPYQAYITPNRTMPFMTSTLASGSQPSGIQPIRGLPAWRAYVKFHRDPLGTICEGYRTLGSLSVFVNMHPHWNRERLHVLALGPTFNRQVLSEPGLFRPIGITIPGPLGSAQRRVRYGLPVMDGQIHKEQRQLLLPCFQKNVIESHHRTMVTVTDKLLHDWPVGQPLDIWREMRKFPLLISSRILFGQDNDQRTEEVGQIFHEWLSGSYSIGARFFPVNIPGTAYHRMLRQAEKLEAEILRLIEEKRTAALEGTDLLSLMIRAESKCVARMSPAVLVGQAAVLFGAGYETTVNALTWTLFLLAQHPSIMTDLLDELDGTLKGGPPTSDQLDHLPLLEAVIKESMRILPPVPYTVRIATRPTQVGPLQLNKDDRVMVSHYITHHMSELYDNPEEFRPRRWFTINPSSYEYLPLSAGPRMCIGYNFAMSVIKVSLAMILQRFRLTVVTHSRIDRLVQVTMRPKFGMPMVLHRQDRQFQAIPVQGNIHEMVRLTEDS